MQLSFSARASAELPLLLPFLMYIMVDHERLIVEVKVCDPQLCHNKHNSNEYITNGGRGLDMDSSGE